MVMGCNFLIKRGEEKVGQHQRMGRINPFLFQGVYIQNKETNLCSKWWDKSVRSFIQPISDFHVSLHGGIPPGRPPHWKMSKVFPQHSEVVGPHIFPCFHHEISLFIP